MSAETGNENGCNARQTQTSQKKNEEAGWQCPKDIQHIYFNHAYSNLHFTIYGDIST